MVSIETIVAALQGKPAGNSQFSARCPAHDDRHASLSIGTSPEGKVLVRCHAGCAQGEVIDALKARGLWESDNRRQQQGKRKIDATYDYCTPDGEVVFQVVRYQPKDFRQRRPNGKGGWEWNLKGVTAPPVYRLPQVRAAIESGKPVLIVEGEKDVHALEKLGFVATCNHGGAGKWKDHHSRQLAGGKVCILPDADEPGRKHGRQVAASLKAAGIVAKVVDLPGAKDATEWVMKGGDREKLLTLIQGAPEAGPEPDPANHWRDRLKTNKRGDPRPVILNAILALSHAPEWQGVFATNEFSGRIEVVRRPVYEPGSGEWKPREVWDMDILATCEWLQQQEIMVPPKTAHEAIQRVAHGRRYHPVRDYLTGLEWDGQTRLDRWLSDYLGAEDTALNRAYAAKWCIGAAARIFKPGAKVDTALICEGGQGIGKSSALSVLGGCWFTDEMPDIGSRDALMQLQGVWIVELAEMTSLSKQETHKIKQFMSSNSDRFREPYAKAARDFPRQCVFAGTINPEGGYLKDPTGARRFWTVECGAGWEPGRRVNLEALGKVRDQLWAEAVARYRAGESWWLEDQQLQQMQAESAGDRYQGDAWDDLVRDYCDGRESVSVGEVLSEVLEIEKSKWTRSDQIRVATALTAMGWARKNMSTLKANGKKGREWRYVPTLKAKTKMEHGMEHAETPATTGFVPSVPSVPSNQETSEKKESSNNGSSQDGDFFKSKKVTDPMEQVGTRNEWNTPDGRHGRPADGLESDVDGWDAPFILEVGDDEV